MTKRTKKVGVTGKYGTRYVSVTLEELWLKTDSFITHYLDTVPLSGSKSRKWKLPSTQNMYAHSAGRQP
jgi:hypothetical protein